MHGLSMNTVFLLQIYMLILLLLFQWKALFEYEYKGVFIAIQNKNYN